MGYNHDELSMHPAALMRISGCEINFFVLVLHHFYSMLISGKFFQRSTCILKGRKRIIIDLEK